MKYKIITTGQGEEPRNKTYFREVEAKRIEVNGIQCIVGKGYGSRSGEWCVWDFESGYGVGYGTTRKGAIGQASLRLNAYAEKMQLARDKAKAELTRDGHPYPVNS